MTDLFSINSNENSEKGEQFLAQNKKPHILIEVGFKVLKIFKSANAEN